MFGSKDKQGNDVLEMSGSRAVWKEVLAVYSVKTATDPDNPQEVATMDEVKKAASIGYFLGDERNQQQNGKQDRNRHNRERRRSREHRADRNHRYTDLSVYHG